LGDPRPRDTGKARREPNTTLEVKTAIMNGRGRNDASILKEMFHTYGGRQFL
jgi:hypothetical protein